MFLTKRPMVVVVLIGLCVFVTTGSRQPTLEPNAQADEKIAYLRGIDVSNWQGTINWTSVKNSGIVFAFCKATEGTTFKDGYFDYNWGQMKSHRIVRGAYHFGRPAYDAFSQAIFFYNVVQPHKGDLQMTLDLEVTDGKTPSQVWDWTKRFIFKIHRLTGRPGIIYTGYYFWKDKVGNPPYNMDCPLWIAAWGTSNPLIPNAWPFWTFWQYSSTGSVPGVNGKCDLDYFNGPPTQLRKLTLP